MCGIAGVFSKTMGPGEAAASLPDMLDAIIHRGPDAGGQWAGDDLGLALGHRRLSILDLSPAGAQPMAGGPEGRFVIVYNGEIYNHLDMRAALEAEGAAPAWRGHSDTETLLAAVAHWGVDAAVARAHGMFAFALWDRRTRRLTLARDRFGEKPLYVWQGQGILAFGSDLASIERAPGFERRIDRAAVLHYFRRGWQSPERTIWQDVTKVAPGGIVEIGEDMQPDRRSYWSSAEAIAEAGSAAQVTDIDSAATQLETVLGAAISRQMLSDVPLGAWLSGGVDSSTVVALMQRQASQKIRTFSIGFSDADYDESAHARAVAAHLGTDHTEAILSPEDAMALVPALPGVFSEPFADTSQLPTILLARMTREHVTVALTGDGADELFGGYNRHVLAHDFVRMRGRAGGLGRHAMRAAASLPPGLLRRAAGLAGYNTVQFDDKYRKLLRLLRAGDLRDLYSGLLDRLPPGGTPLVPATAAEEAAALFVPEVIAGLDPAEQLMHFDTRVYMPEDVLVKVDRAAMSASLETRAPFLDPDVFALAWHLPSDLKVAGKRNKAVLRHLLARHVPQAITERPKQGFSVPVGRWLTGPLRDWGEALMRPDRLAATGLFDATTAHAAWAALQQGDMRYADTVWDVLIFMAWAESRALEGGF